MFYQRRTARRKRETEFGAHAPSQCDLRNIVYCNGNVLIKTTAVRVLMHNCRGPGTKTVKTFSRFSTTGCCTQSRPHSVQNMSSSASTLSFRCPFAPRYTFSMLHSVCTRYSTCQMPLLGVRLVSNHLVVLSSFANTTPQPKRRNSCSK